MYGVSQQRSYFTLVHTLSRNVESIKKSCLDIFSLDKLKKEKPNLVSSKVPPLSPVQDTCIPRGSPRTRPEFLYRSNWTTRVVKTTKLGRRYLLLLGCFFPLCLHFRGLLLSKFFPFPIHVRQSTWVFSYFYFSGNLVLVL